MVNIFKNTKIVSTILFSMLIILGIFLFIFPLKAVDAYGVFLSLLLIFVGVFFILKYCVAPVDFRNMFDFYKGLILFAIGVLILFIPTLFIFGISLIFAFVNIKNIIKILKEKNEKNWKLNLIYSIILSVFSATIAIISFINIPKNTTILMLGILFVIVGTTNIAKIYLVKQNKNELINE